MMTDSPFLAASTAQPIEINAMGQPCPMPLLLLKRELKKYAGAAPQLYLLKSSDPHSQIDVQRYCQLHALACQTRQICAQEFHYLIQS